MSSSRFCAVWLFFLCQSMLFSLTRRSFIALNVGLCFCERKNKESIIFFAEEGKKNGCMDLQRWWGYLFVKNE